MSPSQNIQIGDVVAGKYRLLAMIGEGGMGVVYLAEHELIEKRLALKLLRAEYSIKPELVSRFQQEAISASRIKHPNVLDVFDFGQLEDGSFFLAMEYLTGHDLAAELSKHRALTPEHAVKIAVQMCRALAAAHGRGVVHRDLKPENVFLHVTEEDDEIVKIVDFGIAQLKGKEDKEEGAVRPRRLTRTGMIFGTPEYMSPEQAKGVSVDLRSDIYGLGVILYEMITGAVPFTGTTFMAVLSAHLTQPVPPMRAIAPDVDFSPELEQAVMRSLEKDREKRFQSMRELASALQQAPEGRLAAPLGGLLPVPEVNVGSFRPARGATVATPPQFGRLDRLPSDLLPRAASRASDDTLMSGLGQPQSYATETDASAPSSSRSNAEVRRQIARPAMRRWTLAGLILVTLVAAFATVIWQRQAGPSTASARASGHLPVAPPPSGSVLIALASAAPPTASAAPASTASTATSETKNPDQAGAGSSPDETSKADRTSPVVLTVQSNLPGATVTKDGFQVCDQTPCTVEVPRGAAVELVGTKGYARGVARVLAQQDQTVNITLVFAKSAGKKKEVSEPGLCEVIVDGLKILRPCQ